MNESWIFKREEHFPFDAIILTGAGSEIARFPIPAINSSMRGLHDVYEGVGFPKAERADIIQSILNQDKNVALMAAAPSLLNACKEFVRKYDCGEARSAISKAEPVLCRECIYNNVGATACIQYSPNSLACKNLKKWDGKK